ncbi:unnamed protein product [Victoria cruziana]
MKEFISQSHALGLIINNLSQPLCSLIFSVLMKSFIDLAERAECIEIGMENGTFDVIIKKTMKPTHSIVVSTSGVSMSKLTKDTKKVNSNVANKATNQKKQRSGWSYDRKFTPLQQSLEEIMGVLLQRGTLVLPKVSDHPLVMGKDKDQFYKFYQALRHKTED